MDLMGKNPNSFFSSKVNKILPPCVWQWGSWFVQNMFPPFVKPKKDVRKHTTHQTGNIVLIVIYHWDWLMRNFTKKNYVKWGFQLIHALYSQQQKNL